MRKQNYVGMRVEEGKGILYKRFLSAETPTQNSHGDQYTAVLGPFSNKTSAMVMVHFGHLNPHCQTVHDADDLACLYVDDLIGKDDEKFYPSH